MEVGAVEQTTLNELEFMMMESSWLPVETAIATIALTPYVRVSTPKYLAYLVLTSGL
jgi:hypothetical protein